MHVSGLNGGRGGPFRARCGRLDSLLLLALLLSLWLLEWLHLHIHRHSVGVGNGGGSRSVDCPLIGLTLEEFINGELESGAGDGKAGGGGLVGLDGERGVTESHAGRSSRGLT